MIPYAIYLSDHGIPDLANGWCFLENVEDPVNPTQNCYGDTQFSVVDGRFWSSEACNAFIMPANETINTGNTALSKYLLLTVISCSLSEHLLQALHLPLHLPGHHLHLLH